MLKIIWNMVIYRSSDNGRLSSQRDIGVIRCQGLLLETFLCDICDPLPRKPTSRHWFFPHILKIIWNMITLAFLCNRGFFATRGPVMWSNVFENGFNEFCSSIRRKWGVTWVCTPIQRFSHTPTQRTRHVTHNDAILTHFGSFFSLS